MFRGKILKESDAALYSMPSLEEDRLLGSEEAVTQDTEDIQRQAYEEGFTSGEKAGFAEGEQKASLLIERLEKIVKEITVFRENLVSDLEPKVIDLAVAIARKIIIEEISTRPEVIVTMVKAALEKLQRVGTITIKINPALHELFKKNKSGLIDIHQDIIFDVTSNVPLKGPLVIGETEEVVTDVETLLNNVIQEIKAKQNAHASQPHAEAFSEDSKDHAEINEDQRTQSEGESGLKEMKADDEH